MTRLHPEVAKLLTSLRHVQYQLELHDEIKWAKSVKHAGDLIEQSDAYGVVKFLGMFGGMGSLNDLNLGENFRALLSHAHDLANRLRHKAD